MAKQKISEPKLILEREYIVPLRKGWLKVPEYKRATKAIKTLKEFIARHMKLYDSDLRKIKIDQLLNNELRFRGMKKPPAKIKVKATKFDNNIIRVELVNLPKHVEFAKLRKEKQKQKIEEKVKEIQESKPKPEEKEESVENDKEEKEIEKTKKPKEETVSSKKEHKIQKSTSTEKSVKMNRKTLSR